MALQYDTPVAAADLAAALATNPSISFTTIEAINTLLNLSAADTTVAAASYNAVTGDVVGQEGVTPDFVTITTEAPAPTTFARAFVAADPSQVTVDLTPVAGASVFVVESDVGVTTTLAATAGNDKIIVGGNGNDNITVTGDANITLDGGDGNDVLITGSGNDVVTGGTGNNHIETGAGNDTINTGLGNDVILAGAGRDLINVSGDSTSYDVSVTGSFLNLTGTGTAAGTSAVIQGGEFVSFGDGHTLAIVETDAEASALRLFNGLLGRDVDNSSAEFYSTAVQGGASLETIAASFLASNEYKSAVNGEFLAETYQDLLGRAADSAAQTYWQDQLANGKTQAEVAALISTSAEAQAHGQSNDDFITSLYDNALGRVATAEDNSFWVGALIGGASRAEVASSIYSSTEAAHHANAEFVDSLYSNALGRDSVPDTDAGKAAWIAAIDQGTLTQADAAIGIVGSPEGVEHNTNVVVVHGAV